MGLEDYLSQTRRVPSWLLRHPPAATFSASLVFCFILNSQCFHSHSPHSTLLSTTPSRTDPPRRIDSPRYLVQASGFPRRTMALSSPPRAESQSNPWARLDAQLVALLGDLYYHGYDSFLCSDIDNNKVLNTCCEYRCEYGNVDSVPVRPQPPPREALMACRAAIKPERYPSAFDWAAAFHHAAWSCLADREAEAPLLRGYSYPRFLPGHLNHIALY